MTQFSSTPRVSTRRGWLAVSPLLLMVVLFLVLGIAAGDFNKVPLVIVFIIASAYALSSPISPMPRAPRNPNSTAVCFPSPNA